MKKSVKALLLAALVISTVFVLAIFAGAAEIVDSGLVMKYSTWVADDSEENVLNDGTANDVTWTLTDDGVLTLSSTNSTEAKMNPHAGWRQSVNYKAYIPWYSYLKDIKSVVVEEGITSIDGGNFFTSLENCESITFKAPGIKLLDDSMIFSYLPKLASFTFAGADYTGFEGNIIDLRTVTGKSDQAFESSCQNMSISVLMPYTAANPIKEAKIFHETTNATFYVLEGSLAATSVAAIKANADNYDEYKALGNKTPYVKNVTIENYDLEALGTISGGIEGKYQFNFDVETGSLVIINKYASGWKQFDTHGAEWQAFKKTWGQYVKTATVDKFDKISFGGTGDTTPLFAGMANLETVKLQSGQRMQNSKAETTGWFQGCTALKSVTFGGELVEGVCDFSGMTFHKDDSPTVFLANIFNGCENIKEVVFPNAGLLTTVKATTFKGCTALEKVTLLENITTIEDGAFASCPDVVLTVVENSYAHTWAQENDVAFELYAEEEESNVIEGRFSTKNELTYSFNKETKVLTIAGTGDVLEMDYVMSWEGVVRKDTNEDGITEVVAYLPWLAGGFAAQVEEVVIEADIVSVGDYMLSRLANCKKITIPDSLTELRRGALAYDNALNVVAIAGGVAIEGVFDFTNLKQFGEYIFDGALANVTPTLAFSADLEYFGIGKMAQSCASLTFVVNGAEKAMAEFILLYETGAYEGNTNYCQNVEIVYDESFNPFDCVGYSVRLTDYNGLRSIYSIKKSSIDLLAANGVTIKEYGTVIGTLANIDAYGYELDAEGNTANEKIIKTPVYKDGEFVGKILESSNESKTDFAVTLVNIPAEHYSTDFAALVYVVLCDESGAEDIAYFCEAYTDIKAVATGMYEDGLFNEETGPVAMEIVNYGTDALAAPVAYTEKSYL